jgi:hypothetical protein
MRKFSMTRQKQGQSFVAEVLETYDVEEQAEAKVLAADLKKRVADLSALLPGKAVPSLTLVKAMGEAWGEVLEQAREVAARSGIDPDATVTVEGTSFPAHDFSRQTYEEFLEAENSIIDALQQEDGVRVKGVDVNAAMKVLGKILGALGVPYKYAGDVRKVLQEMAPGDMDSLVRHLKAKRFGEAKGPLIKILNVMRSKPFVLRLGKAIGAKSAKMIVAKIAAKFIPIVGWAYFAGELIWKFAKQIF